jgi:hypothetical protein
VKNKKGLVPYDMVSPGFEAMYTGEKDSGSTETNEWPLNRIVDEKGNVIEKWSTWTWTDQEKKWNNEIKYINSMQEKLGHLDDKIRQIRAHIGSLVICEPGIPVTIDELLNAIGLGQLPSPSFHNGCWCASMWWETRGTQIGPGMEIIENVLTGYLAGKSAEDAIKKFSYAEGFIRRTYEWLGPIEKLTPVQKLMLERMLLPFEFFSGRNEDYAAVNKNCFEEGGRGPQIDKEIASKTGLPPIYMDYLPMYKKNIDKITDPKKKELYKICCHIAHGIHGLSDCHHNAYRYIEAWIHGIGRGTFDIPTRNKGSERKRLGQLLFGYALGLDKWLLGRPMKFLLLDLGHIDLGFDPRNEILRVYAYLGEEKNPIKQWLAACLYYNLVYNSNGGLHRYTDLLERASGKGMAVYVSEWMDSVLKSKEGGGNNGRK